MKVIYLDNNATTAVAPEVFEAMRPFLTDRYGNPSSMHTFGGKVHGEIEKARMSVAAFIGAEDPDEIVFTSCGTESDNTAIFGTLRAYPDKRHIITTKVEHPAVLSVTKYLEQNGYTVTYLRVNADGALDMEELKAAIRPDTALISIMHGNNETGIVFPVEEISKIAHEQNVLFHTDAVQTVGKIPLDVKNTEINFLSLSGHKLHAPKGVGALYIRKGTRCVPFMMGGHQEKNRRGGTENVASLVGLGMACTLAQGWIQEEQTMVRQLRDMLEKGFTERIAHVLINGASSPRLPNTSNISFAFVEGESILLMLDEKGVAASSGSACTSGSLSPSHVLRAMDIPPTFIQGSIRFSLSRYTKKEEIDYVLDVLPPIIQRLRDISPYH